MKALPFLLAALALPVRAAGPDLAGTTWTLARVDNVLADGTVIPLYGPQPAGLLVFDRDGNYALQIYRAARLPFASGDKSRGTAAEYAAAAMGSNAHFGRYAVDAAAHTLTFRIRHASFPNWDGQVQVRNMEADDRRLRYTVAVPTSGQGAAGIVEWQRTE